MIELDKIDENILHEMQRNGRISNIALAALVGLSPSACLRRVQELEKNNVITGYHATINKKSLGIGLTVFIAVTLSNLSKQSQESFIRSIEAMPEVKEWYYITGKISYWLRVELRDMDHFQDFSINKLANVSNLHSTTSSFVVASQEQRLA